MRPIDLEQDVLQLCNGNTDAASLILNVWDLCEVWDDMVDRDRPVTSVDFNSVMCWTLFQLPHNKTMSAHPDLWLAMKTAICNWMAANHLESTGDPKHIREAYHLRCSPYDFFVSVVLSVAGMSKAVEAATFFRGLGETDRFDDYLREHLHGMD